MGGHAGVLATTLMRWTAKVFSTACSWAPTAVSRQAVQHIKYCYFPILYIPILSIPALSIPILSQNENKEVQVDDILGAEDAKRIVIESLNMYQVGLEAPVVSTGSRQLACV